jgi:hypothetical protein
MQRVLWAVGGVLLAVSCARPATVVTLERDGRQRSVRSERGDGPGYRLEVALMPGGSAQDIEVTYACIDRLVQPYLLGSEGLRAERSEASGMAVFTVPECAGRTLVYNVSEPSGCELLEKRLGQIQAVVSNCQRQKSYQELSDTVATLSKLRTELTEDKEKAKAEADGRLKAMDEELALREKEKQEFISMATPAALAELKKTQALVATLSLARSEFSKKAKRTEDEYVRSLTDLGAQISEAQTARDALCRSQVEERDRLAAEKRECGGPGPRVLRLGALVTGEHRKTAWYRVDGLDVKSGTPLLTHQGDFPVLLKGDELYVQVVDRDPGRIPRPFGLQVTLTEAAEPNPAPLRPVYDAATKAFKCSPCPAPEPPATRLPYTDEILPADRELRGGNVPDVGITYPVDGDDGEKSEPVTVVRSVLPQVRSLYRFNLSAGMALSSLDEVKYSRKTLTADDPDTADVHEGAYQTVKTGNTFQIQPLVAFTVYWLPMDIQETFAWTDLLPSPTIGFGLLSPLDNLYLGFSHEFVRNLQLVWGLHLGKVTHLLDEDADALELRFADAPKTVQAFEAGLFGSIQFNFNFFARMFGK